MITMIGMIITTPTAPPMMYVVMVLGPIRVDGTDVTTHISVIKHVANFPHRGEQNAA